MNTIEDLRTTLAAHADRAGDPAVVRSVAIRERVRQVRTRRAAAVSAVVAVVVAAVGLVVLVPRVANVPVAALPDQVEALHFTYELTDTELLEVDSDRHQVEVAAPSDDGQWGIVLGARGLGVGTATVVINAEPAFRIRGDERSALYPIPHDTGGNITVKVNGSRDGGVVSVGIYKRTGAIANDAISDSGRVFPAIYGGKTLIGGEFGDPDDTVVRYSFRTDGRPIAVAPYCLDPTGTFEVRYRIDGEEAGRSDCNDEVLAGPPPDLAINLVWKPDRLSPGRHMVTLSAVRPDGSTNPPEGIAVHLGIAVYEAGPQIEVGAMEIDEISEQNGRRWRADRVIPISKTRAFSTEVATGKRPALVGYQLCGGSVTVRASSQHLGRRADGLTTTDDAGGCRYTVGDQLLAYDTYDVALEATKDELGTSAGERETFSGAVVVYRPVD